MSIILVLRATRFSSLMPPQVQLCRKQGDFMQYNNLDPPLFYRIDKQTGRRNLRTYVMNA
jgi:hypothetical protein